MVSYLAVWNQIQGWIQDFLIASGSILQSGWEGGGSIWLLYLLFFPDFFENSPWNLNNVIEGVSGEPCGSATWILFTEHYSTDTIFFNIWRYCNVALVSSVKASPFGCGYCRVGLKINVTMPYG